ncbi:hypothetical protein Tco_0726896 [Tanacetum coccineum]|uniref:Uncharacterized protein n=1 Tax=Tanacetum coccineum TaxID=301880 RepID=A0ABQ4YHU2_9ASTR
MEFNKETIRLVQEAEKQRLLAQKVQQENTTLSSQFELLKERNRILEGINKDNNYLKEFLEADERAKRYYNQAQSQLIRDRDIIRDLEKQREKLELDVKDHKRQKEEYQKTQTIFKQTQRDKEEKYLNDIIQLQDKIKDLENVVCKMGRSTDTLRLLTNEQKAFRDNLHKSGVGYNGPCVLSQAYAKIPKLYRASELCDKNEQLHVFDSEETLEYAEQKRSAEQTFCSSSCISSVSKTSSEKFASKTKPSMASMPSANPMLVILIEMDKYYRNLLGLLEKNHKRESFFYTSKEEQRLLNVCIEGKYILREWQTYFEAFQNLFQRDIKEMKDTNKDLHDEIERISKESNDVSFEVTQGLSKRIVELEKDLSKSEAKENENFMASLQLENVHLKQTYKDLFESVQWSKVEIKKCDKVKVKDDFDEIETRNIELEYRVASLIKENEHLKLTYKNLFDSIKKSRVQTKTSNVTQDEAENPKSQLFEFAETKFKNILEKIEFFKKKQLDISELNMESGENVCDNAKSKFEAYFEKLEKTKAVLERQLAHKVDDSKAEKDQFLKEINLLRTQLENLKGKSSLSKPVTAQSLPKDEKDQLLKRIAYLESKLASQDIRSCQKEYHELRTSYNALKVKFDSLNRQKWNINVSKSSKPKESVSEKVHTGESSKPFSRRVSQFTTYSLQKDRKFSMKSQSFETFSPHKSFKTRASNENNQSFETSPSCFTPIKQVWSPIKESQTFEASSSQKSFKTSNFKGKNHVFVTPHSHFTPVKQVWRPKQSHSKSFKYSKSEMLSMQNKNDFASTINKKVRFSNETNFQNVSSNDTNKWKSSSSTRFKTPHETPSFKNQWSIKRNFKSPLIPRELFSNETPVSSPRWNSTSLHRLDTTFNWFSKFGKPVSTVLKWVPKVVV